jgi:hypothetical protein
MIIRGRAERLWRGSVDEIIWTEPSGRDAFWTTTRAGDWFTRSLLDAGEPTNGRGSTRPVEVTLRLSVELADQWDRRDLLRD